LNRFKHNMYPVYGCLPQFTRRTPVTWSQGLGPCGPLAGDIEHLLPDGMTDYMRATEHKYKSKLQPRNRYNAMRFLDVMSMTPWETLPTPRSVLSLSDCIHALENLGVSKSTLTPLSTIRPPSGITSVGAYWNKSFGLITGSKGDHWITIRHDAVEMCEWILAQNFTWSNILVRGHEILERYNLVFIPGVRLDRGEKKLRLLFAGDPRMYVLETASVLGTRRSLKMSDIVGVRPSMPETFREVVKHDMVITGDAVQYDQHQHWLQLYNVYMAWQMLSGLPESLICAIFYYNCFAPTAIWNEPLDSIYLQFKIGMGASGAGIFADINSLLMACLIQANMSRILKIPIPQLTADLMPIIKGDDHCVKLPGGVSLATWAAGFSNFGYDVSASVVNRGEFRFLRKFYNDRFNGSPIVFSRIRNLLCPEHPAPQSRDCYEVAVAMRAQLIYFADPKNPQYRGIYKYLTSPATRIAFSEEHGKRVDHLLTNIKDVELSRIMSIGGEMGSVDKGLMFAKRSLNIVDSLDVLL